jgi:hypothetical protein
MATTTTNTGSGPIKDLGRERLLLLRNIESLKKGLHVYVLSMGDWSWALAWAQLGFGPIKCVPLTDEALGQYEVLRAHPSAGRVLELDTLSTLGNRFAGVEQPIVCGHFPLGDTTSEPFVRALKALRGSKGIPKLVSVHSRGTGQGLIRSLLGDGFSWNTVHHRALGGLTTARLQLGWSGFPSTAHIAPGQRRLPLRPLWRFLEPSERLSEWRHPTSDAYCWRPLRSGSRPFEWPWRISRPWVEAPTCYAIGHPLDGGQKVIERPFLVKERCQLLDLREDWAKGLLECLWAWNGGAPVPLRLSRVRDGLSPGAAEFDQRWKEFGRSGGCLGLGSDKVPPGWRIPRFRRGFSGMELDFGGQRRRRRPGQS